MWRRVACCTKLVLALLGLAAASAAQPGGARQGRPAPRGERALAQLSPAPAEGAAAGAASPFDSALQEADRRFVAGDLAGALQVLQPVCVATDSAECAFSLGAIHHGLGQCPEALAHYRRYLQLAPRGEHLAEVKEALLEVEGRCGDGATAPALPAVPSPSPVAPSAAPPVIAPAAAEPSSLGPGLTVAAFAASGAAAVSSVVFGALAARSARRCQRADAYDQRFIDECEVQGPRYQGLWQGFAVASGAFLGVGVALWWSESRASSGGVSAGVSSTGLPGLALHGHF